MNALIETLNRWGEAAIPLAGQVLWQTSLLIIVLLALDLLLRHRIRAGFRYALWMLLLVKLVLPPSLALPTGAGYWIERPVKAEAEAPVEPPVAEQASLPAPAVEVNHPADPGIIVDSDFFDHLLAEAMAEAPPAATTIEFPVDPEPSIQLTRRGRLLAVWLVGTWLLLGWMLWRWRWVNRLVRASEPAPAELQALLANVYQENVCRASCPTKNVLPASCRHSGRDEPCEPADTLRDRQHACPTLRLTDAAMSPAVCGLFRPVILLPRKLVGKLSREQLATVLLHELIHLRRRDLWVNCVQTLLQIAAWWHPLLWLANARIRRVREEAVDEAVACALRDDADAYPATLLEVAKLTFTRPLMTLGLVGILESKHALKQRIRRLLELPPLESTRLKWWQWVAVAAIALVAVPMAEGQRATDRANDTSVNVPANAESNPTAPEQLETRVFRLNPNTFYHSLERISESLPPYTNSSGVILKGSQAFQSATKADGMNLVHHFVRAYFEKFGVKLEASKSVAFNERTGVLMVRAALEDLDIIQRAIEALNTEPAMITLEVRTVEVRAEDVAALSNEMPRLKQLTETDRSEIATLSDSELNIVTNLVGRRGLELKQLMRVTTLSGRNTELTLRDTPLIVAPKFGPQFDKLEVNPYALVDRENLQMTIIATIRARMVDEQGKGSPHAYSVSQKALATAMKDGQTLMFAVSASLDDSEEKNGNTETLVFITPTLTDPVGNSVNETQIFENQGSAPPQSGVGNPAAGAPRQFAAVNTTRPPITMQVRAVKLSRHAWQELVSRTETQPVTEQTNVFIHRSSTLNEWLNGHAGIEIIESAQVTVSEHQSTTIGDFAPERRTVEPYSQVRIELTPWFDQSDLNQIWLKLDTTIDWSGLISKSGYVSGVPGSGNPAGVPAGSAFSSARGYVNQQIKTDGVGVSNGHWVILGGRTDARTIEPIFAVMASPLFAQGARATPGQESDNSAGTSSTEQKLPSETSNRVNTPPLSLGHTHLAELGRQMPTAVTPLTDPRFKSYPSIGLEPRFMLVPVEGLTKALGGRLLLGRPLIVVSNKHPALTSSLIAAGAINHSLAEPFNFSKKSGFLFHWQVAKEESSTVSYRVEDFSTTNNAGGNPRGIAYIAKQGITASAPDWVPLTLLARPIAEEDGSLRCTLSLATGTLEPKTLVKAEETIPLGGSLVWASTNEVRTGFAQVVVLRNTGEPKSKDGAASKETISGRSKEVAGSTLGDGAASNAPPPTGTARVLTGDQIDHIYVLKGRMFFKAADGATAEGLENVSQFLSRDRFVAIMAAPDVASSDMARLLEVLRVKRVGSFTIANLTDAQSAALESSSANPANSSSHPPSEEADESADGPSEAATKIQNAKQLIEAGKLDEAEALLREAVVSSTAPTEVYYHLDRIQQMKSAGTQRPEPLETRVFRVNPNTFYEGLKVLMTNALPTTPARTNAPAPAQIFQDTGGGGVRFLTVTNDMSVVNVAVRDYFELAGVKFEPPKMIYFNDRTGLLMVRATLADLEIVQRAVEMLNYEPPQVSLEVRTVEVTKDDMQTMGLDWFLPNTRGTITGPLPGRPSNTIAGILTDPQFRAVMKALEQRANVSVEFFPRTTTLSGHQTQLRRSESTNVVTGVTNTVAGPEYGTEYVAVGTTVTLSPFVLEDGHTIDLLADVRLVQFLGYDDPVARGLPAQVPLPHFNRQSTRQSMKIRSGDTMFLSRMTSQQLVVAKDKVPVLGDIPLLGRLFRHEERFMETRHVLVFITPTIIDPAGNRVYSAEQMPFTQDQVPRQPGQE